MNQKSQDPSNDDRDEQTGLQDESWNDDDSDTSGYILRENAIKNTWDSLYSNNDELLFCSGNPAVHLETLHPSHVQILQLWQIYLENFDPLLKVTHAPTLQARIINAMSNLDNVDPALEALMFSIYSAAIFSLSQADCVESFQVPRDELLARYQLGAREALLKCGFLKTGDRDCLTALHFYLMTVKPLTDPRSLSATLGITARIAQRMGIHDEATNSKHPPLEAELRRRLWWSLVLFDARVSEMTDFRLGLLLPTWDCKQPSSVNDFDLRHEMKRPPEVHSLTSEALFAVLRAEFGNFIRYSACHLDFVNPALKAVAEAAPRKSYTLEAFEEMIEAKYLQKCDSQIPLHYMTTWWARGQLAKCRFIEHISYCSTTSTQLTDKERDAGISSAISMLECDTKLMTSQAIKSYRWMIYLNFPFPAYVHIVQDLRRRPLGEHTRAAWDVMGENCIARFRDLKDRNNPMERKGSAFFKIFAGIVLHAWTARQAALTHSNGNDLELPPLIVTMIQDKLASLKEDLSSFEDNGVLGSGGRMPEFSSSMDIASSYGMDSNLLDRHYDPSSIVGVPPQLGFDANAWGWPPGMFHPILGNGW
ncbi:hypothetical protein BKA63DRAFT_68406 [Paraphoma chrysanthemicola]|nr:hypothetical protein BKA63DRAFT_68406 [Paraphoma chrysanthemicola]